jgi:hypothetical protein
LQKNRPVLIAVMPFQHFKFRLSADSCSKVTMRPLAADIAAGSPFAAFAANLFGFGSIAGKCHCGSGNTCS